MATGIILSRDRKTQNGPMFETTIGVQNKRYANRDLEQWVATHGSADREYSIWVTMSDWEYWLRREGPDHSVEWVHDDNF